MAKTKVKFDAKDFLLRRGEVLVMGVAGFCLVVLLFWGVTKWASAEDPGKIAKELATKSDLVKTNIANGKPSEADLEAIKPAEFIIKSQNNTPARTSDFPGTGPIFDPVAQPNTKRENPTVWNVRDYQVDLVRGAMPGYDIIYDGDGEPQIAVLTSTVKGDLDKAKLKEAVAVLKANGKRGLENLKKIKSAQSKSPPPSGPGIPPGGVPGFPPGGTPGKPGMGMGGGSMSGPYGMASGSGYNANTRRIDEGRVIKYVPLKDIDEAVGKGNQPALTVIPIRLVTIHAVVPYKAQLEEIKRALRITTDAEAKAWGPWYDGFEIQRRETRVLASGVEDIIQEWVELPKDVTSTEGNYKFEEKYIDVIDTRKIADHFDEGYFPYFLKPEMMLSMPLPLLAKDLNVEYPKITLKPILDNIKKLEEKNNPKITASELAQKLTGMKKRQGIYGGTTNSADGFGYARENFGGGPQLQLPGIGKPGPMGPGPIGPGAGMPKPPGTPGAGMPRMPDGYDPYAGSTSSDEVENYLLRFVDCDVKPGHTYEYRIRLRMWNPNYGQDKLVSNPAFAKEQFKMLYSKWMYLPTAIPVPAESFLYAFDTKAYREQTAAAYEGQKDLKELLNRLQIKDNQAVVQMASWMEQVRTDAGTKQEPVGAWVVTEIPVGRGEYVGRKQYVKLPLWSSEAQQYQFREVSDKVVPPKGGKEQAQPKGWLVDFSTKSILVDFEGGKIKSRSAVSFDEKGNVVPRTRTFEEEVATEMLIVRADGKLVVRSSLVDEGDEKRKDWSSKWSEWLKLVEAHKSAGTGAPGELNPFDKK